MFTPVLALLPVVAAQSSFQYTIPQLTCSGLSQGACELYCSYFQGELGLLGSYNTYAEKVSWLCTAIAGQDTVGCWSCVQSGIAMPSPAIPGSTPTVNDTLKQSLLDWANTCATAWESQTAQIASGSSDFPSGYSCNGASFARDGSSSSPSFGSTQDRRATAFGSGERLTFSATTSDPATTSSSGIGSSPTGAAGSGSGSGASSPEGGSAATPSQSGSGSASGGGGGVGAGGGALSEMTLSTGLLLVGVAFGIVGVL